MSRNAVLSTLAVLIAALVLLGDATNVRSRRSEHEQHVLAGTVQQGRIEAEQLQKAGECKAAEFPFHQMAVNSANFKAAVRNYASNLQAGYNEHDTSWQPHRAAILDWAVHHDFGFKEAVEGNGYKLAPLFDGKGDLVENIQKKTNMATAFAAADKAKIPFYDANGSYNDRNGVHRGFGVNGVHGVHAELRAVAKPQKHINPGIQGYREQGTTGGIFKPILAEDFGQLHEAYSALLFLDKKYAKKKMKSSSFLQDDVAGMALIAGTLSGPNFGTKLDPSDKEQHPPLDRIGSLHVAVKLLSASKGSPPHKYSGSEGAAYRLLFEQMEKVLDGTTKLSKTVNGLAIDTWFYGGYVGDFLYLLKYKEGSICKQANSFAEFFAYGGLFKASKGELGYSLQKPFEGLTDAAVRKVPPTTAQASWNAFWRGQPGFVAFVRRHYGMSTYDTKYPSDKTGRDKVMAAMKQCDTTIFSTCTAFTTECKFADGYWQKKK